MKALSFYVNGELYAVDTAYVLKTVRKLAVYRVPAAPEEVMGIAGVNGKVVTIMNADPLINGGGQKTGGRSVNPACSDLTAAGRRVVNAVIFKPVSGEEDRMGIAIDKPGDFIELDEGKASRPYRRATGITARDGAVYRLLDIASIIKKYRDVETYA